MREINTDICIMHYSISVELYYALNTRFSFAFNFDAQFIILLDKANLPTANSIAFFCVSD